MSDPRDNPACATGKIRLYVDADLAAGAPVGLSPDQSHYLVNVMRLEQEAPIRVFNGRDGEWQALLTRAHKKNSILTVATETRPQDSVPDLQLWFAPVKKVRLDFLVQKATELGVAAIRPVMTRRTNVARLKEDRLVANVIEAAEQCGRLTVPEVLDTVRLDRALDGADRRIMYCDEGEGVPPAREMLSAAEAGPWAILIGPEGGFDPEERAMLRAHTSVAAVGLGPRIMRADTAAIAALTLWQALLGDW